MYRSFDEEVFLSPESIVAGVVASAAFDDDLDMPDRGLFENSSRADEVDCHEDTADFEPRVNTAARTGVESGRGDAWARHACAANGFGG
jgi:hypothetical protein